MLGATARGKPGRAAFAAQRRIPEGRAAPAGCDAGYGAIGSSAPADALALIRPFPAERMAVIGQGEGMRSEPGDEGAD